MKTIPDHSLSNIDSRTARGILFEMILINEFEHAVLALKNDDCVWGPVHTSVGQEAVAAATMAALRPSDKIAGTHRAHHQFLSKVLNWALPNDWDPCTSGLPAEGKEVVRRTLAEIMGLAPGYCGGRGGSMHLRHAEAGVIGTNAIVGGGIPLATGAAFAEKFTETGNIVVCFFSDGAANQGAFHEAANLAAIWNLPIVYFIENNHYAVATSSKDSCAVEDLALHATSYGMNSKIVDGSDPAAIFSAVQTAAESLRSGETPWIIEAKCYRRYHHAGDRPGSAFGYRSSDEESAWATKEPVSAFPDVLKAAGMLDQQGLKHLLASAKAAVAEAVDFCTTGGTPRAVRPELWPDPKTASIGLRSSGAEFNGVEFKEEQDFAEFAQMRFNDAIAAVTGRWLDRDSQVFVLGEEVANFGGGAYGATKGLPSKYPDRVLNTPISEAGFVGLACGAAMSGLHPIVEIMFPDFALVAADQLFNQAAKARHMYGNTTNLPLVARTRIAIGCGYGGQHSMDPVALYSLFPGWRIVYPSTAFDYMGLFNSAMQSQDPVLIVEHHELYNKKMPVPTGDLDYCIELGKAQVVAQGEDVTVITYGWMTQRVMSLLTQLQEDGVRPEIIDLRSLDLPSIDFDAIAESVKRIGAAVVIEEAPWSQSIGAYISAQLNEQLFDYLDHPVARVASLGVPNPVSRVLEQACIVSDDAIVSSITSAAKRARRY
jgi:2-oxoisovalerate dehydrogenase E1 component